MRKNSKKFVELLVVVLFVAYSVGKPVIAQTVEYKFPWNSGESWSLSYPWHTGYTPNAIDFGHCGSSVLAAASGMLHFKCQDGYQAEIQIKHADGGSTYYVHLDANTVDTSLEGKYVERGQLLGSIYTGRDFTTGQRNPICIQNYPTRQGLRYDTRCGCGTDIHFHFELPRRDMIIDGVNTQNLQNGQFYTSSNVQPTPTPQSEEPDYAPTFTVFKNRLYQAVVRGSDNAVMIRSTEDGNNWLSWWEHIGNGYALSSVSMVIFQDNLYQAVRGTNDIVYTRSTTNGIEWSAWEEGTKQGQTLSNINMVVFHDTLYQVVRGTNNIVYTRSTTDGIEWSAWEEGTKQGQTLSNVNMIVFHDTLYQAVRGTNNIVYTRSTTDGIKWSTWEEGTKQGQTLSSVNMVMFHDTLYQAVRGTNNIIYTRSMTDGIEWGVWEEGTKQGQTLSSVNMAVLDDMLYQAVRGINNIIYTRSTTDGVNWSTWNEQGGAALSSVGMIGFYNRLYQTITGTDSRIYDRYSINGETWQNWTDQGCPNIQDTNLVNSEGRLVTSSDHVASVNFPPSSTSQRLGVAINSLNGTMIPSTQGTFQVLGHVYEFSAFNAFSEPVTRFDQPISITFSYNPGEFHGVSETDLEIGYYDESVNVWIALPSTVNTMAHTVTAVTDHFTKFAILTANSLVPTPISTEIPFDPKPTVNPPHAVPEPTTFLLIGIGLLRVYP